MASTGNKIEIEFDFATSGEMPLALTRTYNHYWKGAGLFGKHWLSPFDYKLTFGSTELNSCFPRPGGGACGLGSHATIYAWRPDGTTIKYAKSADGFFYEDKPGPLSRIERRPDGRLILWKEQGGFEQYSSAGYIESIQNFNNIRWTFSYVGGTYPQRVTHTSGRYVEFSWTNNQLTAVRDPSGSYYGFAYTSNAFGTGFHRLAASSQPGDPATTISYHYERTVDSTALTGKSYNGIRYSTFTYDANGYATSSQHGDQDAYTFSYTLGEGGRLTVLQTNPLGKQTTYVYVQGKVTTVTGHPSAYCPATTNALTEYDSYGYPSMTSDFNDNLTSFTYNAQGQLLSKTEAYGTPEARTTTYEWWGAAYNNQIMSETLAGTYRRTYHYGADARISRISVRNLSPHGVPNQERGVSFQYTYHAAAGSSPAEAPGSGGSLPAEALGMLASVRVDGPIAGGGDVLTSTFDAYGNLISESNSLGHQTSFSQHNGLGAPGKIVGGNEEVQERWYDQRGRAVTIRLYPNGVSADTRYTYGADGLLVASTTPDGVTTRYVYDAARRLVQQYHREAGGTYAYQKIAYNAMSLPLSITKSRAPYPHDTRIAGYIDGVYDDGAGNHVVTGWACSTGVDSSIDVHMYLGGPAGSGVGFAYTANQSSEPAVAAACQAQGAAYRFRIPLDTAKRQQHGGQRIYIHGISPAGRDNSLIAGSGAFSVPVLPGQGLDKAEFISQSVPTLMEAYTDYTVSVTLKNTGTTTWSSATGRYALGAQNPHDNTLWTGANRVALPHSVSPGQTVTVTFVVTAPSAGYHNFQWRMVNDGVAWFGDATPNVVVHSRSYDEPPPCGPYVCENPQAKPVAGEMESTSDPAATDSSLATMQSRTVASAPGETVTYATHIDYDELGRVRARRGNGGQHVRYSYDNNGNVKSITDVRGRVTTMDYDALDRVVSSRDSMGGVTYIRYDAADRPILVTDPRGFATSYIYDGFGQLWAQRSPDTGTTTFSYDEAGLKTGMSRSDGSGLGYRYDSLGRLTWYGTSTEGRAYSYDWCQYGKGRLCAADYESGTRHFGYSPEGQVTITRDWTPATDDWTHYRYDEMGRIAGISYPSGVSVGYGYHSGVLTVVQAAFNGVTHNVATDMQYLPHGPLARMVFGSGQIKDRAYDLDGRMTVTHDHGLLGHSMHYNESDEIVLIENWSRPGHNERYEYDALSRLTSITGPSGNQSISYDANGNRTHQYWMADGNNISMPYAVDGGSNRLHSEAIAYSHDGRGNRSSQSWGGSTATFGYDAFNRLKTASRDAAVGHHNPGTQQYRTYSAGTTTYTVNALDQRVAKSGPQGTSRFVYGGQAQMLAEASNGTWSSYIWMGNEAIGMVRNNQLFYFNNDHLGRPEIVTNQARQHVWHAANFAFDRAVTYDAIGGLNLGFPGQYYDSETGFWQNGFRDYDSRTGRYLQSDPIGLAGGINTYAYVGGNPVNYTDSLGLMTDCEKTAYANAAINATPVTAAFSLGMDALGYHVEFIDGQIDVVRFGSYDGATGAAVAGYLTEGYVVGRYDNYIRNQTQRVAERGISQSLRNGRVNRLNRAIGSRVAAKLGAKALGPAGAAAQLFYDLLKCSQECGGSK